MFELRCFKRLPFANVQEYQDFVKNWMKENDRSVDDRVDVYIMLPAEYNEWNSMCGLKIRGVKLKLHPLKVKLKGRKLELKMRTKVVENKFELWQKIIEKKMKKEVKFKIWSQIMMARVNGLDQGDKAILKARKSQALEQMEQVQEKIQKKMSVTSIFVSQEQVQDESNFWIQSEDLQANIQYLVKVLRAKIKKYNLSDQQLLEYVDVLEKAKNEVKLYLAIVEKRQAKSNEGEECTIRLRVVHQKSIEHQAYSEFGQFFISSSVEQGHPGMQQHVQQLSKWNSKYGMKFDCPCDEEQPEGQFIGGYPEFISKFAKLQ